jgi:hypothetical protein
MMHRIFFTALAFHERAPHTQRHFHLLLLFAQHWKEHKVFCNLISGHIPPQKKAAARMDDVDGGDQKA